MIPVSLTLEGLYSYQNPQSIDFEKLTSNQLFGIFGTVGSGKSSILEAIIFVLYGETDRLNSRGDSRYYNMLNLQSERLYIDFECRAGQQNQEKYRFTFEAKRRKEFEKVEALNNGRRAYRQINGEWQALENWSTEEILGLNYRNFKTTTIIPQGKFREFIEQPPAARTGMLQEIFQLDKFDLAYKAKEHYGKNKEALDQAQGKFSHFETVSEEVLETTQQSLLTAEETAKKLQAELATKEEAFKKMQQLLELSAKLKAAEQDQKWLKQEKKAVEEQENQLKKYRNTYQVFHDRLIRLHDLKKEEKERETAVGQKEKELKANRSELTKTESEKMVWDRKHENREADRLKCEDLERAVELRALSEKLAAATSEHAKAKAEQKETEGFAQTSRQKIDEAQQKLIELKKQIKDLSLLHEINKWFERKNQLETDHQNFQQKKEQLQTAMQQLEKEKERYLSGADFCHESDLAFADAIKALQAKKENFKAEIKLRNEEIGELKVQVEVADLKAGLVDGEPCPVCGSEHHPAEKPEGAGPLKRKVTDLQYQVVLKEELLAELEEAQQKIMEMANTFGQRKVRFEEADFEAEEKQKEIAAHQTSFFWKDYSQQDQQKVEAQISAQKELQAQIMQLEKQIFGLRKISDEHTANKEKLQVATYQKAQAQAKLETQVSERLEGLKVLTPEQVEKYSLPQLTESLNKGKAQLAETEENHRSVNEKFNQLSIKAGELGAEMAAEQYQLVKIVRALNSLQEEIDQALADSDFNDVEAVKSILRLRLDMEKEQQEIDDFKTKWAANEATLQTLRSQMGAQEFSAEQAAALQKDVSRLRSQAKQLNEKSGELSAKVKELEKQLLQKAELQTQIASLSDRQENLKTLMNLFRGKGFVEYVSTVYLQHLVQVANHRFMRLTRNSLSLELNEANDFIVRDYLNNGKVRLLKTLSGGQTFQAALCLALALAENVKSLNQADQSFFFLDEGFGTLDKSALQTVFETLKSLRQENRIVGIISHVEDLQQEIEVFLSVENHKETGSSITPSW